MQTATSNLTITSSKVVDLKDPEVQAGLDEFYDKLDAEQSRGQAMADEQAYSNMPSTVNF